VAEGCQFDKHLAKPEKKKLNLQDHEDNDRPLGLQEVWAPRNSRQSAREGGKVINPTYRPLLPPKQISLVLISVRG